MTISGVARLGGAAAIALISMGLVSTPEQKPSGWPE
jgi:hypothetical protein